MNGKYNEGDLYRSVDIFGKIFNIYYGYYEDYERDSLFNDPVPVYPNLRDNPEYDGDGNRIVTEMQIACPHYNGTIMEDSCSHCPYYQRVDDLFGICLCEQNRKNE